MRVGILSDSHGRFEVVRRAMSLFDAHDVVHVIHCGDVGGIEVLEEMLPRPCHFVWGNCDLVDGAVRAFLQTVGLPDPASVPLRVELGGKRFAVFHGHEREARRMADIEDADYLLHGHTHLRRDERVGALRVINPGALHRASPKTVAVLDVGTDDLTFHELG